MPLTLTPLAPGSLAAAADPHGSLTLAAAVRLGAGTFPAATTYPGAATYPGMGVGIAVPKIAGSLILVPA